MTNTIVFVNYTQPDNSAISGYAISVMYVGLSLGSVILGPPADRYEPKTVLVRISAADRTGLRYPVLIFPGNLRTVADGFSGDP